MSLASVSNCDFQHAASYSKASVTTQGGKVRKQYESGWSGLTVKNVHDGKLPYAGRIDIPCLLCYTYVV